MGSLERRGRCSLLLVILSLVYFARLGAHPTHLVYNEHSDILSMHYPVRVFAVTSWRATHALPLWCPYCCSGQPFQADPQATLFYPPHLIFYIVPVSWVAPLFGVLIWAHVLIAGLAMFGYARDQALAPVPALVAAVGFMFAGKWLVHVLEGGHVVFLPLAWFPLLLLCLERAIERRRLAWAGAAGVVGAVIVTGSHPQLTLYSGLLAALFSLRRALSRKTPHEPADTGGTRRGRLLRDATWWVLSLATAGLVAAGLAAVQLLPSLEFAALTGRAAVTTPDEGQYYNLTFHDARGLAKQLLALLGPKNFSGNPWESVGDFGVLWAGVALLALGLVRRPAVWFHGAMLLLLILCGFGSSTPVYSWLRPVVSGLSLFRIAARVLLFAGFPLGMLAGWLTQEVFETASITRQTLRWASGLLLTLVIVYLGASLRVARLGPWQPYWVCLAALGPMLAAVLVWRSVPAGRGSWPAVAWLALLLFDLWAIHWPLVQTRPVAEVYPPNDAIRFLAEHPGHYRVLDRPLAGKPPAFSPLTQALCYLHRVEWVRGYNPTDLASYKQFLNFIAGTSAPPGPTTFPRIAAIRNPRLLDLLDVRYLLSPAGRPLAPDEAADWQPVQTLTANLVHLADDSPDAGLHHLPPYVVFRRKARLPRAFVVSRARIAPPLADLLQALRAHDLRRTVVLERPRTLLEKLPAPRPGGFSGPAFEEAAVVLEEPNRVVVEVTRAEPGYLVLLDVWYPGWQCSTAEGRELPVWRADSLVRAVPLPAGRQRLEFVFAPRIYRVGRNISLAALAALLGWVAVWSIRLSRPIAGRRAEG